MFCPSSAKLESLSQDSAKIKEFLLHATRPVGAVIKNELLNYDVMWNHFKLKEVEMRWKATRDFQNWWQFVLNANTKNYFKKKSVLNVFHTSNIFTDKASFTVHAFSRQATFYAEEILLTPDSVFAAQLLSSFESASTKQMEHVLPKQIDERG